MQSVIMMWTPSGGEWLILLVLAVMLFGLGKLPAAAKQLGSGVRNFQRSLRGEEEDADDSGKPAPKELESEEGVSVKASKEQRASSHT